MWGNSMENDVNIIRDTVAEELERNRRSRLAYEAELSDLPKGSVSVRTRGGREYCYLKYREGERVVTEYVGPASQVEEALRDQVSRRKEVEKVLKRLKKERAFAEKALRHR